MDKLFVMGFVLVGTVTFAQNYNQALKQTQDLLNNKLLREQQLKNNPNYNKAMGKVNAITGGDPIKNEQMMNIASEVFGDLVKGRGGDTEAVKKMLEQGMRDPASFLNSLPAEQRRKIKELADKIENGKRGRRL